MSTTAERDNRKIYTVTTTLTGDEMERRLQCHDALVAACEAVLAAHKYDGCRWVGKLYEAKEQIVQALAAVRGEAVDA